jgi:DNA-binding Lrp family transcriptional regulator
MHFVENSERPMTTRRPRSREPPALLKDKLDRDLLALLQTNARESTANLARKLAVARTTVLARLARLEKTGIVVGYTARLGKEASDRSVQAYVGIRTEPKSARDVVRALSRLAELKQLVSVSGEFDYIALLSVDSMPRLDAVLDEIGEIAGVKKTTTSVVLALRVNRV